MARPRKELTMGSPTEEDYEKAPEKELEPQTKLTARQLADEMGISYIEPTRKLPAFGELDPRQQKEHDHDWEYVKGIYENSECVGEPIEFWMCIYPGDPDCLWRIPSNKPVFVPRMVAKHLEDIQKYHRFEFVDRKADPHHEEFKEDFKPVETLYRGKFRPLEAFK